MTKLRCYLRTILLIAIGLSWFSGAMADLKDGLAAYYPFNGNANDSSGSGNHGVVYGYFDYR
ncbi:secreted protein [Candidatus Thiomargarita nelsonii]|uniref:Secreted protein n=1 Tax=Candidatus Thiomargarita nelsonii TaxID=1003181 RepID=A0A176RYL7_9GAMM|nr:secreted protein [Candidatus Thiomargarita nelsonii]